MRYGAGTYRIVGYGLSALLLRAHVLARPERRLSLLPARSRRLASRHRLARPRAAPGTASSGSGGAGFTGSVFVLLFVGRVFQISYLVYPLTGLALTGLIAVGERDSPPADGAATPFRGTRETTPTSPNTAQVIGSSKKRVVEEAVHGDGDEDEPGAERDA